MNNTWDDVTQEHWLFSTLNSSPSSYAGNTCDTGNFRFRLPTCLEKQYPTHHLIGMRSDMKKTHSLSSFWCRCCVWPCSCHSSWGGHVRVELAACPTSTQAHIYSTAVLPSKRHWLRDRNVHHPKFHDTARYWHYHWRAMAAWQPTEPQGSNDCFSHRPGPRRRHCVHARHLLEGALVGITNTANIAKAMPCQQSTHIASAIRPASLVHSNLMHRLSTAQFSHAYNAMLDSLS